MLGYTSKAFMEKFGVDLCGCCLSFFLWNATQGRIFTVNSSWNK